MDGLSAATWFPVFTLVAGVMLKSLSDWWSEGRRNAMESRVRVEKRREALLMQRIENQRKLLPDLQEAIAELMRSVVLVNLSDTENCRRLGHWKEGSLPAKLDSETRSAFRSVSILRVRVQDEKLRAAVSDLSSACSSITLAQNESDSRYFLTEASFKYESVNELLGEALRALDSGENAVF